MVSSRYISRISDEANKTMRYLPLFRNVRGRPCLVVGGGPVAQRKIALLLRARADITVVAPTITAEIRDWYLAGRLAWRDRIFSARAW